jgi:hypothetical protein
LTAFDTAWSLLKMPFHGTSLSRAKKIMEEGLKARKNDAYDRWYGAPSSFSTPNYDAALDYAASAMWTDNPPAVIHISEDVEVDQKPAFDVNVYNKDIPPEMLSIMWQGPPANEGEKPSDYRERISALMDAEYKRWWDSEDDEPE